MIAQHTPGPWHFNGENVDAERCAHKDGICQMLFVGGLHSDLDEQVREDARLIAAAPDLLEALKFVLAASGEQLSTAFEQAQAAIAKATGESA